MKSATRWMLQVFRCSEFGVQVGSPGGAYRVGHRRSDSHQLLLQGLFQSVEHADALLVAASIGAIDGLVIFSP